MEELVKFWSDWVLLKLHLCSGREPGIVSVQSSKKQKERSSTGQSHGACWRAVYADFGSCTGRDHRQHGPCNKFSMSTGQCHGPCKGGRVREWSNTGRVLRNTERVWTRRLQRAWTVLFFWHGSRKASTGHVKFIFSTGRADWHGSLSVQHGSRLLQHGSSFFCTGRAIFSSSEVGNLIFSQYSGFIMIWEF